MKQAGGFLFLKEKNKERYVKRKEKECINKSVKDPQAASGSEDRAGPAGQQGMGQKEIRSDMNGMIEWNSRQERRSIYLQLRLDSRRE